MAKNNIVLKGTAFFPHLNTPNTMFNPDGTYDVFLQVPEAEGKKIIEQITAMCEPQIAQAMLAQKVNPAKAKKAPTPWATQEENDKVKDGCIGFKIKNNASFELKTGEKKTWKPQLFDASAKLLDADVEIGYGSELLVSVYPSGYYTGSVGGGVTLRLGAVQVAKLVSPRSAASYGFTALEGSDVEVVDDDTAAKLDKMIGSKSDTDTALADDDFVKAMKEATAK